MPNTFILLAAAWITIAVNVAFWRKVWDAVGGLANGNYLFLLSMPIFLLCWNFVILWALCWGRLMRPMMACILVASAAGSYFLWTYGIVIDASMLMNVVQTDVSEASELLTPNFIVWMLIFGAVPGFLVFRIRLRVQTKKKAVLRRLGSLMLALVAITFVVAMQYQSYASLVRNNREIRLMIMPSSIIGAVHSYAKEKLKSTESFQQVGLDAKLQAEAKPSDRKKLLVLIVGETARSMNFSLNGYERLTNPMLASRSILSFANVSSCGTATAVSVPCLFQEVGKDNWKNEFATSREGLLDVLQRAGVNVLWRDNNSGCKSTCDRVNTQDLSHELDNKLCQNGECFDEILLSGLQGYLDNVTNNNSVIVLHMKGSHGPAYSKRYPPTFEKFTPVCNTSQLDQCSDDSIVNAYDNSILYSDHVVSKVVDMLAANSGRFDSAMLYVSDHGESLGEKGVYLHGLPYAMAPKEQTQVPMLLWMAPRLAERQQISESCLAAMTSSPLSHDNVFHSVLGLIGVNTSAYNTRLDIFSRCRTGGYLNASAK
jgi:lipid A ethanolaminephosphotransferase